jgi:PadR family transcriptional regulator, regulatory protein AphA
LSTKHVILALLDVQPMTGYDLAQNLKISVDTLWAASFGQIYPTLHKLEQDGFVQSESQVRGTKMERIVYELTSPGRRELHGWLEQPIQYLPLRDPFKLWAAYLDAAPAKAALRNIEEHIRIFETRAEALDRIANAIQIGEHPLIQARKASLPKAQFERLKRARSVVFSEMAAMARFEIESAKRIRALALELHPELEERPLLTRG